MKKDGSEKKQLTHLKEGFAGSYNYDYNFAWSFDSNQLAFFINPVNPDLSHSRDLHLLPSSVQVIEVMTGALREIYSDFGLLSDLSWYHNGEKLLMTKLRIGKEAHTSWVQSVCLRDGFVRTLAKFNGLQQFLQPEISQDGLQVAILYNAESDIFDWMPSIGIVASEGNGDAVPLVKQLTFDSKFVKSKWSKDGRQLFALRNYGAYNQIYTSNSQSGELKQITNSPLNIINFEISPDGLMKWLA